MKNSLDRKGPHAARSAPDRSEQRYRTLYNRTPAMMYSVDAKGCIIHVSDHWLEVMGYARHEVLGRAATSFLTEPSRRYSEEIAKLEFAKTGVLRDIPLRFVKKDGDILEVLLSAIRDSEGRDGQLRSVAVLTDVTERNQTEQALRESERKYRELSDLLPLTVFECDLQGKIGFINRKGAETFAVPLPRTSDPLTIIELVAPHDRPRARRNFAKRLQGEPLGSNEYTMRRLDDTTFPGLVQTTRVIRDNRTVGVRGTVVDLSEQKEAEEERRRLGEQVLHAQKLESLGVLSGGIAHDFNNLLMSVLGNASLALMELPDDSPARASIEAIETTAKRAADLTRQLLAYAGKGQFVMRSIDLSRLVSEMTSLLQVSISKKVRLTCCLDKNLPAVEGDPTQLRQIVMNLITNASDSLVDNEGEVRISTQSAHCSAAQLASPYLEEDLPEGQYVSLEVSDDGCGMPPETLSRIFDPFFSTKFTGRGLGLAAVLGIVRAHRAAVQVRSQPGGGTTFRMLFPASPEVPQLEPLADAPTARQAAAGRVLVVDDEKSVRELAGRMLEQYGYSVILAEDGRQALDIYRRQRDQISLVLLDMTMPRMDGEQTARALRRTDPQVRIVLSSGYSEESADSATLRDLAGFLQKPYRPSDLVEAVEQAMGE